MDMENEGLRSEFSMIMEDLESENMVANVAAVNRASALITGGKLPDPVLLCRLISGLASNLLKPHQDISVKLGIYSSFNVIKVAITSNHMNMDSSACGNALHAIHCCFMDEAYRSILHRGGLVRLWPAQTQLITVRIICVFFRRSLVSINDARCVTAFASLMLSPYIDVVHTCADALLSLPQVVPGFAFSVARAYCNLLIELPPQSSLQIDNVVMMLEKLKQISQSMVDHPGFNNLAMDVLKVLANQSLAVRKKLLNLAVCLLTPLNIDDVLRLLRTELDTAATAGIPIEYHQMLEEAIRECHSSYPGSTMRLILDPKYLVFADCIGYIKKIMEHNPLLRTQLLKGFLKVLRHVKSSPVCVAAVWAISVCSVSLMEVRSAILAITCLFEDLLYQREILKEINGGEVQHDQAYYIDICSAKAGLAQGRHQQPWLMEMEELLFVHVGLTRQGDGSYAITSSSSSSIADGSLFTPSSLEPTDNLARVVGDGDVLLAEFVGNVLSSLVEKTEGQY